MAHSPSSPICLARSVDQRFAKDFFIDLIHEQIASALGGVAVQVSTLMPAAWAFSTKRWMVFGWLGAMQMALTFWRIHVSMNLFCSAPLGSIGHQR